MTDTDIKQKIQTAIQAFGSGSLTDNAVHLFNTLGYNTTRQAPFDKKSYAEFKDNYGHAFAEKKFSDEKALTKDWKSVDLLFQLTIDEVSGQLSLFDTKQVDNTIIETYLFFAVELEKTEYTRTQLAQITREINKVFPMPVMIVFKYGQQLTLSVINRRLNKKDEHKDVLEKVTLIKDIAIQTPHRAHVEILFDLSMEELKRVYKITTFVELHNAWQKNLDTRELNKRFYKDLSNWYFWAVNNVVFPDDVEKNEDIRNATSVIRLLTRLVFCWFMKEKGLIPPELFDKTKLDEILYWNDSNNSTFYKAVLQNLFFATLNTDMAKDNPKSKRRFRSKITGDKNSSYMIHNVYRYENCFKRPDDVINEIFERIPFINGGLFECLDKSNPEDGKIRIDGFSDKDNVISVPDRLFFGDEHEEDLNEIYGTKGKHYKTKGIIHILNAYKFTITENTPVEEEIALDPELLGRVFENLLACYNPETKTTARKQTGSFYTPREIVNYMVDESLKNYFKTKLQTKFKESENLDEGLDRLLRYTEKEHPFEQTEAVELLIDAIDNLKIIDPACGSGAFPMGLLQKLVYILGKLDHGNNRWKEKQLEKLDDSVMREELEKIFENYDDYGRKLYLVENCIFGVDIQTIAIQICKLRFFISLLADQKIDRSKPNLGVRPLPNLETKFVAANTLISLEKPTQMVLRNLEIDAKEKELNIVRRKHFSARSWDTKKKYRDLDEKLRGEIANLLINDGWEDITAKQIAHWFPYNQNVNSSWFDSEWMFGVKDGFDIVIGNPPYVQIQNFSGMQEQKDWERQKFETYAKTGDIYCLFYERGYQLLRNDGVLTYITSNKWMRSNYGKVLRKYFNTNGSILQLIDFGDSPIFENATTYTNILVWEKNKEARKEKMRAWDLSKVYASDMTLEDMLAKHGECDSLFNEDSFVVVKSEQTTIKKRIEELGVPLKDWNILINRGIITGYNEAFVLDAKQREKLASEDSSSLKIIKPILRGRDIKKYKAEFNSFWIIIAKFGSHKYLKSQYPAIYSHLVAHKEALQNRGQCRYTSSGRVSQTNDFPGQHHWMELDNNPSDEYLSSFEAEKILYAEIVYDSAFYYDTKGYYPEATTFIITGERLKFLTALLNSKLLTYAFKKFYAGGDLRGDTFRYKKIFIELLPVPKVSFEAQLPFEILVDCILFCKSRTDMDSQSTLLESVIDGLVYDLYFPDEMKAAHCYITDRIASVLKPFTTNDSIAFKIEYIKTLEKFINKDETISHSLVHRHLVKPVQIILGDKK